MALTVRKISPEQADLWKAINDTRRLAIGAAGSFHIDASEQTVTATNATDLPSTIALANQMAIIFGGGPGVSSGMLNASSAVAGAWLGHINDADAVITPSTNGPGVAHKAQDTTNTLATGVIASDQGTANTLLNLIKAKFNAHLTQAGVHFNNDGVNSVATADASDAASSQALANALKTSINAHMSNALPGQSARLVAG